MTTLEPKMPFGKYRGVSIGEVLRQDPGYLVWFCDSVQGHEVLKQSIRAMPGFPEASAKRPQQRHLKASPQTDPPNMGVDPGLSREQLDKICRELLDEARAGRNPSVSLPSHCQRTT